MWRGGLVDQQALAEALGAGIIAAAGLDVIDPEPIDPDDALLGMPNCIIVPHIASASVATAPGCASWPWPTWSPGSSAEDASLRQPRGLRGASRSRTWSSVVRILLETKGAHAAAAADDPEWALWYADHALESLRAELGGWLDHPQPVTLLLDAARSHRLDSPAEPWASHYARRLVSAATRP